MRQDMLLVVDMGSTRNTDVARAIRALGVYSEICNYDVTAEEIAKMPNVKGIVANGGPNDVVDGQKIGLSDEIKNCGLPVFTFDYEDNGTVHPMPEEDEAIQEDLRSFIFDTCKAQANWNMENFIADQIELIRKQVGDKKVLLALSGGVDSSVVAALLLKAIGSQLTCVHVNHGLLRKGEPEQVVRVFKDELSANLIYVDATERFLSKLEGVADPEQKRKIIGAEFIRVFEEEARKLDGIEFLAQGTIYPDIVESGTKTAKMVKSHHNVGGLPASMVYRQPFPGPGLGVRCLGAITRDRLEAVRESDAILREEFAKAGLEGKVWQYFTIVPDFKSVGVRDNARCFDWPVIIRAVNTIDAMTAQVPQLDWAVLQTITARILQEVKGVNRVCFDLSPKPTATIEWE